LIRASTRPDGARSVFFVSRRADVTLPVSLSRAVITRLPSPSSCALRVPVENRESPSTNHFAGSTVLPRPPPKSSANACSGRVWSRFHQPS
jgi:hypothetical protein